MQSIRNITQQFSHRKSYDVKNSSVTGNVDEGCGKKTPASESFGLGYRHIVAFYSFFYIGMTSTHTTAISISIVAMVNHTQITLSHTKNTTVASCPISETPEHGTENTNIDGSFDWDAQTQGNILGFSTMGYILTIFFSGRIGEIFGAKRILLVANLFINFFTLITPTAAYWSVYALTAAQILRGFFQGFIIPCAFIMMANWFPRRERGLLSSFAACGSSFWACVSGLVIGKLCDIPSMRWPSAFYVIGGADLLVTMTFAFFYYDVPKLHPRISKAELEYITGDQESDMSLKRPPAPWKAIFTSVPVYALTIGKFGFHWSLSHFLYMHPTFMGTVLHFSMTENGLFACIAFLIMTMGSIISMTASFWLRQKNILGVNNLRKGCSSISAFGFSLCLVGVCFAGCDAKLNIIFCCLAEFFAGVGICGTSITGGDMSPKFSGSLAGFTSSIGSLAYTFMPLAIGAITKHESLEEWNSVFYMHIAVIATCGIVFQVFGSAEIQAFDSVTSPEEKIQPGTQLQTVCKPDSTIPNSIHI